MELFFGQDIGIWIDAFFIEFVQSQEGISDFIGRIRQHQIYFFCTSGDTGEKYGETVAGSDREDHADIVSAELVSHIFGDIIDRAVIALCSCDNRFRDRHDISVMQFKSVIFSCFNNGSRNDLGKIIAFFEDRAADAP